MLCHQEHLGGRELFLALPCLLPCVGRNGAAEQHGRLFLSAWELSETG